MFFYICYLNYQIFSRSFKKNWATGGVSGFEKSKIKKNNYLISIELQQILKNLKQQKTKI